MSEFFAILRTDGEDVDHEYVGYFQQDKILAFGVADELADNADELVEFAVYELVRVERP